MWPHTRVSLGPRAGRRHHQRSGSCTGARGRPPGSRRGRINCSTGPRATATPSRRRRLPGCAGTGHGDVRVPDPVDLGHAPRVTRSAPRPLGGVRRPPLGPTGGRRGAGQDRTQRRDPGRRGSEVPPTCSAPDRSAAHDESGWCAGSHTNRTARSRTSGEYCLGLPMDSILPRHGASHEPGAVQSSGRELLSVRLSSAPDVG